MKQLPLDGSGVVQYSRAHAFETGNGTAEPAQHPAIIRYVVSGHVVVAFESRRAAEIAELVRKQGGSRLSRQRCARHRLRMMTPHSLCERLFAGEFDTVILLTGRTRRLNRRSSRAIRKALSRCAAPGHVVGAAKAGGGAA